MPTTNFNFHIVESLKPKKCFICKKKTTRMIFETETYLCSEECDQKYADKILDDSITGVLK